MRGTNVSTFLKRFLATCRCYTHSFMQKSIQNADTSNYDGSERLICVCVGGGGEGAVNYCCVVIV